MKNTKHLWQRNLCAIAIIAIISFAAVSCGDGSDNGATAPVITTTSLPGGSVGVTYSQTLAATGDTPITWSVTTGSLPAGLTLAAATGVVSGTPTAEGTSTFTVKAENAAGENTKQLSIAVTIVPTYTVTFDSGTGGTAVPQRTGVVSGTTITAPATPTRPFTLTEPGLYFGEIPENYTFVEWRNGATAWNFASSTVTGDITLTAHWTAIEPIAGIAANDVAAAVTRSVLEGAANDGKYTLVIDQNVTLTAMASMTNPTNLLNRELTIIGLGEERIITAPVGGAFRVAATYSNSNGGASLILGENITIKGVDGMTAFLIEVRSRGSLIMKDGSKITGFSTTTADRYPVAIFDGGSFIMDGGEISGNTVDRGTSNNSASAGVWISRGTFTMNGGTITGNTLTNGTSSSSWGAGGVSLGTGAYSDDPAKFVMNGGTITGNTRNGEAFDVHIPNPGAASTVVFTYTGGTIGAILNKTGGIVSMPATP